MGQALSLASSFREMRRCMLGRVNLLKCTLICGSILIVMFGLLQFVSVKNAHADEIKLNTTYNVNLLKAKMQ